MPSHAEVAAKLLRDAAGFFRNIGDQNEPLKEQMYENADVFEQVALLVEAEPTGELDMPEGALDEGGVVEEDDADSDPAND